MQRLHPGLGCCSRSKLSWQCPCCPHWLWGHGAVLIVKPGCKNLGLFLWKQKWAFSHPLLPSLSIIFPWKKAALNFFPGLSCWGRAQWVASACHVTLVFAVSHAMTSQADWRTMEIKLLYVKMEKLSLSRKQAGEHQLQMARQKKKKLVWVDEGIAFKRQTQLPPMSMESLTQTLMAMESCPKALYFLGWCQIVVSQTKLLCYYNKVFFDSTT